MRRMHSAFFEAGRGCQTALTILACDSFFVRLGAVSSSRPTFQSAPRAAAVKRGAEQPGATRSDSEHGEDCEHRTLNAAARGATMVVGGELDADITGPWFIPVRTSALPRIGRGSGAAFRRGGDKQSRRGDGGPFLL